MASSTVPGFPNFASKKGCISDKTLKIWIQTAMEYDHSDPERARRLREVISASMNYSKHKNWHVLEDQGSKEDRKRYQTARDAYNAEYGILPYDQEPAKGFSFAGGKAGATSAGSAAIDFGEMPECNRVQGKTYSTVRLKGQQKAKPA
jgi:hypothetical protein